MMGFINPNNFYTMVFAIGFSIQTYNSINTVKYTLRTVDIVEIHDW